jgi:hypothetical protein
MADALGVAADRQAFALGQEQQGGVAARREFGNAAQHAPAQPVMAAARRVMTLKSVVGPP